MIKNSKGFVVTEVLILSTVIIGLLVFMYVQFKNINRSYQYSFKYDTVDGMYLANNIVNYINENKHYSEDVNYYIFDKLVNDLKSNPLNYIDITDCSTYDTDSFCENLISSSNIEQMLFTYENTSLINTTNLDEDLKKYIKNIQTQRSNDDYRIIIKYKNGTYASMRFNKGDKYVQSGLIAYLDGINNTGNGHSNETSIWKDLSGNNNDATLYNNPVWSNNSITFNGIDNYGRLENTVNQEFPDGVTIETRVKVLSFTGTNIGDGTIEFFSNWELAGIGLKMKTNQVFRGSFYDTNWKSLENINASNLDQYYTLVLTYNNTTQNLYVDGNMVSTDTYNASTAVKQSEVPFGIGINIGNPSWYANVEFQNVLIYDRALTADEVQRNYNVDTIRY